MNCTFLVLFFWICWVLHFCDFRYGWCVFFMSWTRPNWNAMRILYLDRRMISLELRICRFEMLWGTQSVRTVVVQQSSAKSRWKNSSWGLKMLGWRMNWTGFVHSLGSFLAGRFRRWLTQLHLHCRARVWNWELGVMDLGVWPWRRQCLLGLISEVGCQAIWLSFSHLRGQHRGWDLIVQLSDLCYWSLLWLPWMNWSKWRRRTSHFGLGAWKVGGNTEPGGVHEDIHSLHRYETKRFCHRGVERNWHGDHQ